MSTAQMQHRLRNSGEITGSYATLLNAIRIGLRVHMILNITQKESCHHELGRNDTCAAKASL